MFNFRWSVATLAAVATLTACGGAANAPTSPAGPTATAQVVGVSPQGGATGVDPGAPIIVRFSRAMRMTDQMYVSLHEGTITGPVVTGSTTWSADSATLTFRPTSALRSHTTYVLHMGGGMRDDAGNSVDLSRCGQFGGQAATGQTMGGMMNGAEMGAGWQTPGGNTYGMVFTFTTA